MSFRPALVDPQGWSHNWQRGWSHVTGKTSDLLVPCDWQTTTYELVMTKKIQSVKVGRRRLVVRSSLAEFVQALLVEQDCA